jgi:hypothetical protein
MIFKNIFAEKFSENIGVIWSNYCLLLQKNDYFIGFFVKNANFSQKIGKNRRKLLS